MKLDEEADIALLLADDGRRRVLAGAGQPGAVARTADLDQPLGAAADRTDLLAERRTATPGAPGAAKRTHHNAAVYTGVEHEISRSL